MKFGLVGKSTVIYYSRAHVHDQWEVVLNLEGEGVTTIGGRAFPFKAGTVICVPPHTPHTKQSDGGFLDMHMLLPEFKAADILYFEDEDHRIEQLMGMIYSIYHHRENNYREITDRLAAALEQILMGRQAQPGDPRVAHIADLAVDNFNDPDFSLTDAMAACGYCEDHLRRLFRRQYGMSPLEYLTDLRIRHAKRLLRENRYLHHSVTQIALMVGFSDVSYFSRVFKKRTGLSPRAYLDKYDKGDLLP